MKRHSILFLFATLWMALVGCNSKSSGGNNDSGNSSGTGSGRGGGRGFDGGGGGGFGGSGGFAVYLSLANPPTGAAVTAPAAATPTVPATGNAGGTPPGATGIDQAGFRIDCTTDSGTPTTSVTIAMKLTDTSAETFASTLTYQTTCSDFINITDQQVATGNIATLTVTLSTLAGQEFATGATAAYTQAAPATTTSTTGGFQRPVATAVSIAMSAPPAALDLKEPDAD